MFSSWQHLKLLFSSLVFEILVFSKITFEILAFVKTWDKILFSSRQHLKFQQHTNTTSGLFSNITDRIIVIFHVAGLIILYLSWQNCSTTLHPNLYVSLFVRFARFILTECFWCHFSVRTRDLHNGIVQVEMLIIGLEPGQDKYHHKGGPIWFDLFDEYVA